MTDLLARIFVFVVVAFLLGLGVGFLSWRFGRHTLSRREWVTFRRELGKSQANLARAIGRLRDLEQQGDRLRSDLTRTNLRLAQSERENALEHARAQENEGAAEALRGELATVEMQSLYLRRRLTDLSILANSASGAPQGQLSAVSYPEASVDEVDVRLGSEESVTSSR